MGQSQLLAEIWGKVYELITAMVSSDLSDGDYFISTIKI
jgi:hypothetical protein